MADKGIQQGDQVAWNYGGGQGTGTVAEIQTQGKLELETGGTTVHRNADPSNPAVHIERSGNDVAKRMSELTKVGGETEEGEPSEGKGKEISQEQKKEEAGEQEKVGAAGEESQQEAAAPPESPPATTTTAKRRGGRRKTMVAAEAGEKRDREAESGEQADAEKVQPKKRQRTTRQTKSEQKGTQKKGGRPRKKPAAEQEEVAAGSEEAEKGSQTMQVEEDAGEASHEAAETEAAVTKKKGPGRPRKSSIAENSSQEQASTAAEDSPASRTRSKEPVAAIA